MNLELTLPIFHLFTGLIMVTAALFSYLSDRKSTANRLLAIVLILISLTSVGIGFQLNSLTPGQALPWVSLDIFVVNALGIATLIISLQLLIPEVGSKPIIRTIALAIVFVPLILLVIDLTGESVNLVGTHFIINLNDFYSNFTPGYSKIRVAADGVVHNGLFWLRNILYMVLIFYPLVFVIWRDRKANPFNRTNAIILLSGTLISAAVNTVFLDILPETVPALISALSYGVILTLISIRNSLAISSKWRTFDFFQNINMFNKFLLIMLGIILPSVIFLGFSIYSLLLKNMVNDSNAFLNDFAKSQAAITANELDDLLHNLEHAAEERSVQDLFSTTNVSNSELQTLTGLLQQSSGIRSVLLIDSRGRLITSSESADSNNYPNTSWWEALSEQQTAYIGSPIWDEEEVSYTLQVVFPATTSNGEFIGAIETKYSLDQLLLSFNHQTNTDLVYAINVSNQNLVLSENTENSIFQLPAWMATSVEPARNWNVISINDQYVFTASQPVITETPTTPLDWEISAYQSLDSALETLYTSRNGLVLISTGIFLITAIAFIFVARGISNPLRKLTESAETLLGGNFEIEIEVLGQDEIGTLANTLNQMASELSGMINSLEATVDNRTKDLQRRTLQMETSAQVARQAAEIRDLQSLLNQSVNLISERFDYYHAGIFLLDNAGRYAVLQAASSPGGQRMLARGHRLQVGKVGVVGYTAGSGQPRISQDVGADVVYYDNPDMP
ncbi:MAG: HAMP domain-containing protein, partial [Chloroflexota bacterium]